jgi:transcriptional regulator with XRE-family HTH domain
LHHRKAFRKMHGVAEAERSRIPEWSLGERLRKARAWAGVSVEQLAADIGRTSRTIRNYENDATTAPLLVLKCYAMRTRVPVRWFQTGEDCGPDDDPEVSTIWYRPRTGSAVAA